MSFKEIQKEKTAQIEQILKAYLPRVQGYQEVIMDAMSYSMLAGGKRLRPMLMQETYRMFGGTDRVIEPFMAAIEMIHTYSLVHDDLPAMDNDEYRRGRKTTHVVYGEDMGILTGDALLNYAFETAASAFEMAPEKSLLIGKAIRILGQKAGIYGMIGGQVVDGYLAFVANPNYIASNGLTFDGMRFLTFSDESLGTATGGLVWLYNLMLEDPGKAVPMSAPAATVTRPQLEKISSAFSAPDNFVELRGRERMRALIDEYIHSDRGASNVARSVMTVVKSEAKTASARVTVSQVK